MRLSITRKILPALLLAMVISLYPGSASHAQLFYWRSEYNALYNDMVALDIQLKTLKRQYANDREGLERKIMELENSLNSMNRKYENLQKAAQEEKAIADGRIRDLERRTDILQKKSGDREKDLIEENRRLQARCDDDVKRLGDELRAERERHATEIDELNKNYRGKIADMEKLIAGLRDEISDLKNLTKRQKTELDRMESQVKDFEKQLENEIKRGEIRLRRLHGKLIINLDDRITFDSGSAKLKSEVVGSLDKISKILSDYPENRIVVEGHTDNVPIRTAQFRDNWQLSTERGLSVLNRLLRQSGLDASRFSAAGYGEFNPIVPNDTPANRGLNRRVDIVVIPRLERLD